MPMHRSLYLEDPAETEEKESTNTKSKGEISWNEFISHTRIEHEF